MNENPLRPHEQVLGGFALPRPEDERDERVKAALQTLEASIERMVDSDSFRQYLETMSRFHRYSFNNVMLIMMQRPDAQDLAPRSCPCRTGLIAGPVLQLFPLCRGSDYGNSINAAWSRGAAGGQSAVGGRHVSRALLAGGRRGRRHYYQ
ncbi:MAG: hypothetical protein M3380_22085 [Chloroflexota bacterium]|nr:hypothetical protein [Chloroflexota bacterium]